MSDKPNKSLFIGGDWKAGNGASFDSIDPSAQTKIWSAHAANGDDVTLAFAAARAAFATWSTLPFTARQDMVLRFRDLAMAAKAEMSELISRETGKLLWDSMGESGALSAKVDISLAAYHDRTGRVARGTDFGQAVLQHKPHGVMAVLGPYNFPAHLPNGQIIPALIAGNTIVFKPSELTPATGQALIELYQKAGFPPGVINLVQGGRDTGAAILNAPELDGLLFTGSAQTGAFIHKHFGGRPDIVLALEMGGNNPLILWDVDNIQAAANLVAHSAFISSGQRCTCARRLIVPQGRQGEAMINAICDYTDRLSLGRWNDADAASLGPLVSKDMAAHVVQQAQALVASGAKVLRESRSGDTAADVGAAFVTPGIYDVTGCAVADEEIFGPVLQVIRVRSWAEAIEEANRTRFGLAAGLISDDRALWEAFRLSIRAGVVNFNRPTTGAAGFLPFGGPGASGNHSPGAYYSADFCAWPMASQVADAPDSLPMQGLKS